MAIVLPSTPEDPPHGRVGGSIFYKAKGRTFVRQRTKPVDPITVDRMLPRGLVASAAKNWAYVLTAVNKAHFDNWSKYQDRGMLEYVGLVMASQISGLGLPLSRSNQPLPEPPIVQAISYISDPFNLTIDIFRPPPPVRNCVIYSATSPTPKTTRPRFGSRRVIRAEQLQSGPVDLTTDYLATFGGKAPDGKSLMIIIELINENIPADTRTTVISATPFEADPHASGYVIGNPFQKLEFVAVVLEPNFATQLPGTPIDVTISSSDLASGFPATIPNAIRTIGSITDTLGVKRTVNFDFFLESATGESVTLPMSATVTI